MLKRVWMTEDFWVGVAERAVKTFAQSLVASIGATQVAFGDVDWQLALSVSGVAALVSVLTSLVDSEPVVATTKVTIPNAIEAVKVEDDGSEKHLGYHDLNMYLPRRVARDSEFRRLATRTVNDGENISE